MNYDITWLDKTGLDTVTGIEYTGGEEKYVSALQRFYKNYEKNRAGVEKYYSDKDWENYTITVHALKSNAKMIGASGLGSLFEELEMAAKAGNTAVLDEKTSAALSAYGDLIEKLKPLENMGNVRAPGEISADEAKEIIHKLLNALDDFDDEESKELTMKLSGYPFRPAQKDLLYQALGSIDNFLYDEAADIIKDLLNVIERENV
ncbi:MAG: hypothetical protein K5985_10830 [Lachnospiraceae bacterium]|nr:hypothetical protein [Lachnospiraceae bacterium]